MKIKKIDEEITFQKITNTMTIDINGKQVACYSHSMQDEYDQEFDFNFDENDLEQLTNEEYDFLQESEQEIIDLEVGGIIKYKE